MADPNLHSFVAPPPEFAKAPVWTTEQQIYEMERRGPLLLRMSQPFPFTPRPTDVIVATSPKSGTTWILHICHQLRMKGAEPDFEEQMPDVTILLDLARTAYCIDPNTMIQPAEPRIFATHFPYKDVPKGGKLIYCFRDQKDALYSYYHFMDSMRALKGRVTLSVFVDFTVKNHFTANNLRNLLTWWEHRFDDDVLLMFYEDIKEDHVGSVRQIAKFIGVDCDEEIIARVVKTTTYTEMVRHHSKFNNQFTVQLNAKILGDDPPTELTGRVRKDGGKSGDGVKLPIEVQKSIDDEWQKVIATSLGFSDLTEMRVAWKKEKERVV